MKKVFISIPWFHPAFRAGGPVQSVANLVNEFAGDVTFYIFTSDTDLNGEQLPIDASDTWTVYNNHTKVFYASSSERKKKFRKEFSVIQPDTLFVIGIYSFSFNVYPLLLSGKHNTIISVRGMLHPGALSQKAIKKRIFLSLSRSIGLHRKCSFHATDDAEAGHIRSIFGNNQTVFIAGNFPRKLSPAFSRQKLSGELTLVTLALISPMKNHLLVLQALSTVQDNITYHICGPIKDQLYWNRCKEQSKTLPPNINIIFHGEVPPAEVSSVLVQADVFIMPSLSENFGHSIYEAMTAGLPVITSKHTPWNNLLIQKAGLNVDLNIAEIASAIRLFANMDQSAFMQWREKAVQYANQSINLDDMQQQYTAMFNNNKVK